jgi:hypothetical protein
MTFCYFDLQPYIVGTLTENQTLGEWRVVFFISCAFLVLTNVVYLIFASGKTQEWNIPVTKSIESGIEKRNEEDNPEKQS